jgi:hypothetical protein
MIRAGEACKIALALGLALSVLGGCRGSHPPDSAGDRRPGRGGRLPESRSATIVGDAGVPQPPERVPEKVAPSTSRARVVVRARARALATSATKLYYGDVDEDGVFSIEKSGGEATRIARRAPVSGGLALDSGTLAWVASPGDAVLRASVDGAEVTTIRDRGIFSAVAAQGGDVFIAEAIGSGGAITRVTASTAARLASFEGPPRGLVVDDGHAYVVTPTRLFKTPHERGALTTLASGQAFEHPQLDDRHVYFVAADGGTRMLVRVPKAGGAMTTLARDVRDAPIAVTGNEIFYFDAARPQLRAARSDAPLQSRVVAEDDALAGPTALATDGAELFIATGEGPTGAVLAIPIRQPAEGSPRSGRERADNSR